MGRICIATMLALAVACGDDDGASPDAGGRDSGRAADAGPRDAGAASDSGPRDASAPADRGEPETCLPPPAPPSGPLLPRDGELFYAQLGLGGFSPGESALIVGPDGTRVLIDVANDSHDDDIRDALDALVGSREVDHVVITHFHADHGDGLENVLADITLRGRIVHRGLTDLTPAANDATIEELCNVLAARPSAGAALCEAGITPPCDPASWTGTYPATACAGLATADLALGAGARLDFVAANGHVGGEWFERVVAPIRTTDSNGENARSVVALLEHGPFRMLIAGDLTGGGSDTDDVETFLASRLPVSALGIDVLHAGHHGRNTSSNAAWAARLLPSDGRARSVVMGISTAHLGSPHAEVIDSLLSGGRLGEGRAWTTAVSSGGATSPDLVDAAGGTVRLTTLEGGAAYAIQAVSPSGMVIETRTHRSVEGCR